MNKIGLTPHINADIGDFAKTVIMPGDPKRAEMIANKFLDKSKVVSDIRGIISYTGFYKGKKISVMAHGMGNPSMGIYSYELFKYYDVENIIRVGSCASYKKDINLYDIIISTAAFSYSIYAKYLLNEKINQIEATEELINRTKNLIYKPKNKIFYGTTHCGDNFYFRDEKSKDKYYSEIRKKGHIGGEMEAFALYANAKLLNKKAIAFLTVAHHSAKNETTNYSDRQNAFTEMIEMALELSISL